ncbi:RNA polymerase II C-terminal domain phosphatase-like 4 [Silene latifolia]|uniref:RNA polymerase II C-terminal domain phosphatase-like 4 n=1 Tax=Silene latifolia TaxID=37657 RepID=UPI003D76BEDE
MTKITYDPESEVSNMSCDRDANLRSLIARKKLNLVLDLDNTLIHAIKTKDITPSDQQCLKHLRCRNWFKEGKLFKLDDYLVKPRPNVYTFLKEASALFDLSVFTLQTKDYANKAVEILDPKGLYISPLNVFSREDCKKPMMKDLDVVNQDERVTLVVDDTKWVWAADNQKNVIGLNPYLFFEVGNKQWNMKHAGLQLRGDESEKYGELARVLRELKKIHIAFFDTEANQVDYENRDVRDVVEDVRKNFRLLK